MSRGISSTFIRSAKDLPSPRGGEALDFFHLYIKTPRGLTAVTPRLELVVKSGCSLFTYQQSPRGLEAPQPHHLTNISFPPPTLATCTSTITSLFAMFKWRTKKSSSYEPKTPKLANISLPDERYVPGHIYQSYTEKPHTHNYLRDFTPNKRASTPLVQPTTYHRDVPSMRSRPRTMSTPVREVEAPRPIRPHPSQGPFWPTVDHRDWTDSSHVALAPVGVPSAAFLEEQLRKQQAERRTAPQPPPKMIDVSDYVYPEETKLREVAKRTGATVTTHHSKAYLESLKDQQRELERVKAPSAPPRKRSSSNARDGYKATEKVICDFEDYKPVPVEASKPAKKVPGEAKGPLKSALKKPTPPPPKPTLKSAMKKKSDNGHNNASLSEPERPSGRGRQLPPPIFAPSKAYLEEQQEKLEAEERRKARRQSLTPVKPTVHEIRPSAFAPTHSSSTGSSPSEYANPPHRRRDSSVDPRTVSSSYITPFIRELDPRWGRNNAPVQPPIPRPDSRMTHVPLAWPLVDFALRRRENYPMISFDTAFNPRMTQYAIKTKLGLDSRSLSEEEKAMPAGLGVPINEMWIVHQSLPKWPIHLKMKNIRVIDVFMWIYDEFAEPLTAQELIEIGPEYLDRCRRFFDQRCRDGPSWQHVEERKGILRVDLLRGKRRFVGLQPLPGQLATYELLLD